MIIRIIAVGQKIAAWAEEATRDYLARFPREFKVELKEIRTEPRRGQPPAKLKEAEAERILESLEQTDFVVLLDEDGASRSTLDFAREVKLWKDERRDVVFIIGGPDGVAPNVKARADHVMKLSEMTLPHALARVFLAEQLYRVYSILVGHPYHRG